MTNARKLRQRSVLIEPRFIDCPLFIDSPLFQYRLFDCPIVIIAVVLVVTTFKFTPGSDHIFNRRHPALFFWTILRVITAFYKCVVLSLTNLKCPMMHVAHHISFITFFFSSVFFAVFPRYIWTAIETSKAEASWKWPKHTERNVVSLMVTEPFYDVM